ncbi:MAG: cobaltochelatase subunit CobN [Hyphomicrobiaceae bacterium]
MHLLVREQTSLDEVGLAQDLGLTPADVVVLSFSDSDLSALATAWQTWPAQDDRPTLRLANLARLTHPMSVDVFIDETVRGSKAVLVRLLGGVEYWRYGVEELARFCRDQGQVLAFVPGCGTPDARLAALSTVAPADLKALEDLMDAGGAENARKAVSLVATRATGDISSTPPALTTIPDCGIHREHSGKGIPVSVVFYRSYLLAGDTGPIDALCDALAECGLDGEAIFVPSLKAPAGAAFVRKRLSAHGAKVVINATAFSARPDDQTPSPLEAADCPVLQVVLAGNTRELWNESSRGLSATDLAMHVVLPELDGRILAGAISFKESDCQIDELEFSVTRHDPEPDLITVVANRAAGWAKLATKDRSRRKVAVVLSTYPGRVDQIAHAVGLDGPASAHAIVQRLATEGYRVENTPSCGKGILDGVRDTDHHVRWSIAAYRAAFAKLPEDFQNSVIKAWGDVRDDVDIINETFSLPIVSYGNLLLTLQPERGEPADRKATYHDPTVPPRHTYVAFYLWLQTHAKIDALIHLGAHGTLEWLPGKAVALSQACAPCVLTGPTPVIYPFIVNDPGEAAQAKRRLSAVTIGHMTPKMITTDLDGRLNELDRLVNEFSSADGLDARRRNVLADQIVFAAETAGLSQDLGLDQTQSTDEAIGQIDAFLCDVKELTIRDGLHIFGNTIETEMQDEALAACGPNEMSALINALDGRFIEPGPSGAPSRGRRDVLPTGRNLTTIDPRGVPTQTALEHGKAAAEEILRRYLEDHGDWPRAIVMDLWGSATMRNGGEEIATALHLMGVRPIWDHASFRVTGIEVLSPADIGRPRVDVTLRISGLFRDVFPLQLALFHQAVTAVAKRDEDSHTNPLADATRNGRRQTNEAIPDRIFGAAPGAYGAGVTDLIDSHNWRRREQLGQAYLNASATAYRGETASKATSSDTFAGQLQAADAFVHIHDHAEADILSSADYAAHEGGALAAAAAAGREDLTGYHVDTARPETPKSRTLQEECARIIHGRATNATWINGQMRHGFRGAAEIAQTVDNAFAFAATSGSITSRHIDELYLAYLGDPTVAEFMTNANPDAQEAMRARFQEAMSRGLWTPRLNSAVEMLSQEEETA